MESLLTDLSSATLARATKANLYECFRWLRRSSKTEFCENPKMVRWYTGIPHPWLNGVICMQPASQGDEQLVEETLAYFRSRDLTTLTWWLWPGLQQSNWAPYLLPRGFRSDEHTPGMAVDLLVLSDDVTSLADLKIRRVADRQTARTWLRTFVNGCELPIAWEHDLLDLISDLGVDFPIRNYLGYVNGKPVATSSVFFAAGVAGLQFIATVPKARRRGIGAAMTLAPLREARSMGYHVGTLQSSEMGYRMYERLGFRKVCNMDHFNWIGEPEQL